MIVDKNTDRDNGGPAGESKYSIRGGELCL